MEGTATWFGLSDSKGRLKPAYYALKDVWTGTKNNFLIKDVYIYSPPGKVIPGQEATFYAITENTISAGLKYEWKLCKDDIIDLKTTMKEEEEGKRVSFTIPATESGLRLYLYVTDLEGKTVNTASLPMLK